MRFWAVSRDGKAAMGVDRVGRRVNCGGSRGVRGIRSCWAITSMSEEVWSVSMFRCDIDWMAILSAKVAGSPTRSMYWLRGELPKGWATWSPAVTDGWTHLALAVIVRRRSAISSMSRAFSDCSQRRSLVEVSASMRRVRSTAWLTRWVHHHGPYHIRSLRWP